MFLIRIDPFVRYRPLKPSDSPLDVIIPLVAPDMEIFPLCLAGIRKNISNKIKNIYVVAPDTETVRNVCKEYGLIYVNENRILGYSAKDIDYVTEDGKNRSGWLFQQLLKLSGAIGDCDNFITVDSDHILVNPHVFLTYDGKFVMYQSDEYNNEYYRMNRRIVNNLKKYRYSFVAHKMIFNKKILNDLKESIQRRTGEEWDRAIIHNINRKETSSFSEFELYGHFVDNKLKRLFYWNERSLDRCNLTSFEELCNIYHSNLSITFSKYFRPRGRRFWRLIVSSFKLK